MNCPTCGAQCADTAAFCSACATNLDRPSHGVVAVPLGPVRTSGMAIAGFVLAFFCGVLGLVFSVLGYSECKRSNGMVRGQGLALAGIIISTLMLVIAVGAAVAIPAFMDYMKTSRRSEATVHLQRLSRAATVFYIESSTFPVGQTELTPSISCCSNPGSRCDVQRADWDTDVWRQLGFSIDRPQPFRFRYTSDGQSIDAEAIGDLDCDGVAITYRLHMDAADGTPRVTLTEPTERD